MFFNVDKALAKLGFVKIREDKRYIVQYERENEEDKYIHCLDIVHKANRKHIIQSYQKDLNADRFNNMVGLTGIEAKLAAKKMKQMRWGK